MTGGLKVTCCSGGVVGRVTRGSNLSPRCVRRGTRLSPGGKLFTCTFTKHSIAKGSMRSLICRTREGIVLRLTRGRSYIVVKEGTSCVLGSQSSILGIFVRKSAPRGVRQVHRVCRIDRGSTIGVVRSASGEHVAGCGFCARRG